MKALPFIPIAYNFLGARSARGLDFKTDRGSQRCTSGAKAIIDSIGFTRGLKPPASLRLWNLAARLKPRPFKAAKNKSKNKSRSFDSRSEEHTSELQSLRH